MSGLGKLRLGTAKIDVTPQQPLPLAGFGHRTGLFQGINRRLYVRVHLFEQSVGGSVRRLLLAQGDIIWWGGERMGPLRAALAEKFGLGGDDIILSAQHTHGGPQTSERISRQIGAADPDYLQSLDRALLAGVETALSNLEPVTVERGSGECRIGIHRRLIVGGAATMAPNPEGPIDPEVTVIRFRKEDGGTKAVLVHYTCHPTTTSDNFVTSDYPGVMAERLEATLGCGTTVAFLQGCTGDIRPALHRGGKFYSGHDEDVRRLGRALADEVERVLDGPMRELAPAAISGKRRIVRLPFQQLPSAEQVQALAAEGPVRAEWARLLAAYPELLSADIPFELTKLTLADGLSLLAMNGEVVIGYGLFVKERSAGRTLPLGYSNGMVGYVPTAAQIAEGGYEGKESGVYFALPAPFDPSIEPIIRGAIDELIGDEH